MSPSCFNFGPGGSVSLGAGKNHPTSTRKPSPISSRSNIHLLRFNYKIHLCRSPTTTSLSSTPRSSSATPIPSHRRRSHRRYHDARIFNTKILLRTVPTASPQYFIEMQVSLKRRSHQHRLNFNFFSYTSP